VRKLALFLAAAPLVAFGQPAPAEAQRGSWYIGFGLGSGGADAAWQGSSHSFGSGHTNAFYNFKIGGTATQWLLVGLDVSGFASSAGRSGQVTTSAAVRNVDVALTVFPFERGLFIRSGLGRSEILAREEGPTLGGTYRIDRGASGTNAFFGVGWAFWLGQSFNLTVALDTSRQRYSSSFTDPESSSFWALWVGADWY
jgi:hypothetical protein